MGDNKEAPVLVGGDLRINDGLINMLKIVVIAAILYMGYVLIIKK